VLAVECGYKQAMTGTISLLNRDGDRLHTIYVGSAPGSGKKTFLWKMRKELSTVIKEFPKATVVGVADGARDNWEFLRNSSIPCLAMICMQNAFSPWRTRPWA